MYRWHGCGSLCLLVFLGQGSYILNFWVCGYASFVYCEASYDTPEVWYRSFVYSFSYDSNVQY